MLRIICILALSCVVTLPAMAQSGYTRWSPPGSESNQGDLKSFVERLNKLVDEAEKAKAADPRFLRDLRELADGVNRPQQTTLLSDSFSDGDFTRSPAWVVRSGAYRVEQNWGLRSSGQGRSSPQQQSSNQNADGRDAAVAILGALLGAASGQQDQNGTSATTTSGPAVITTSAAISNAFTLTLEFSSWRAEGQFAIGPYQGDDPDNGYRLVYSPGQPLELQRLSSRRGAAVIERSRDAVTLEDQKAHRLEWTRRTDGQMRVMVDGKEVLKVTDVAFRDAFSGLAVSNAESDIILRSVEVLGVR
ncbi:MAG: hypothetical protein RLN80_06710 [Rhodospirillales bacterium]